MSISAARRSTFTSEYGQGHNKSPKDNIVSDNLKVQISLQVSVELQEAIDNAALKTHEQRATFVRRIVAEHVGYDLSNDVSERSSYAGMTPEQAARAKEAARKAEREMMQQLKQDNAAAFKKAQIAAIERSLAGK